MDKLRKPVIAVSMLLASAAAFAMPPRPGRLTIPQPDGSAVEAELYGDGDWCVYVAPDGGVLEPDKSGRLLPTGRMFASDHERLSALRRAGSRIPAQKSLAIGDYPTKGKIKTLIILAEFSDMGFVSENPADLIGRMVGQRGFCDNGATGSVRDYFADCSFGQFELDPVVLGPVTLPGTMSYYGAPVDGRPDIRPEEMIRDACVLVDDMVDFAEFDLDGDGYIDNVYVFYPGYSQADGAAINTIWPHSGYAWAKHRAEFDGVKLDKYACSNEIDLATNKLVGIGTFCHEFSHVLGLPDLYATDYSNEEHPDIWSIMAAGARNNSGHTPPALSAYERYALGWTEPEILEVAEEEYSLASQENRAFIIPTASADEYYIVENRQRAGWDAYLPGHGLLIWHIDYDEAAWKHNYVNNDASHQRIDLVEANHTASPSARSGNSFPGASDVRELAVIKTWYGPSLGFGLFNIRENADGSVSFHVADNGNMLDTPLTKAADELSPVSFRANWETVPQAASYVLDVYRKVREGSVVRNVYVDGYRLHMAGADNAVTVTGLTPSTEYFYVVRAMGGGRISAYSAECQVTTLEPDFRSEVAEGASASGITPSGFTANWEALEGATAYMLTVSEVVSSASMPQVNDFADGVMAPEGWGVTAGCTTSSFTGYYGAMAPGLSMTSDGACIQSPFNSEMIEALSFWYRGVKTEDKHAIKVSGYDGRSWRTLANITSLVTDKAGTKMSLKDEFADVPCYSVRIAFMKPMAKGSLVLDDITVEHARTSAHVLTAYDGIDVGNVLSATVEGLKPSTLYSYSVTATDGTFSSVPSVPRLVRTLEASGITTAVDSRVAGCTVSTDNNSITVYNPDAGVAKVGIYSVSGICLLGELLPSLSDVSLQVPPGIYIVITDGVARKIAM